MDAPKKEAVPVILDPAAWCEQPLPSTRGVLVMADIPAAQTSEHGHVLMDTATSTDTSCIRKPPFGILQPKI